MLPVSAPFHSSLMQPAADAMREALAGVTKSAPVVPVISNVRAAPVSDPDEIAHFAGRAGDRPGSLARDGRVVLRPNGVDTLAEIGAGKVLSGLARRIDRSIATLNIAGPDDIDPFLAAIDGQKRLSCAADDCLGPGTTQDKIPKGLPMFDLTGRKALVTGASGGIGEAIARQFHARGATVGLHGTRVERLEALAADLGERVMLFPADLSDRDAVSNLGKSAEEKMGGVDILVNNAGITKDGLFVRMSDEAWDQVLEVDLTSAFRLTRELAHPMMKRRHGRVNSTTTVRVVGVAANNHRVEANYCADLLNKQEPP